jgi:hypothetical protein
LSSSTDAGKAVLEQCVRLGGEALRVVRVLRAGHASDAVQVGARADIPEVLRHPIVLDLMSVPVGFERAGDLRDVLVGVLAAERVHVACQSVRVLRVAEEEVDVVEQLRALEKPPVAADPEQAGHDFVHPAVFARDVTVPQVDARFVGKHLESFIDPEAHAFGDLPGSFWRKFAASCLSYVALE